MTKKDKRLTQLLNHPESLNYKDIEWMLLEHWCRKVQAKGSHVKFKHSGLKDTLVIPIHNNDCKPFYKKQASAFIRTLSNL